VGAALTAFTKSPYVFLLLVNIFLLIVGCFLEGIAAIVLIAPILIPVAQALGISQLHFGMVVIMNLMIGLITPPLGLCLFVACSVAKVDLTRLIRASFPFLAIEIVTLFIVTYFPFLTLFIPNLFGFR
jgi:TRAP-type C4-dicarboxylate transport system permease large subunit